MTLLVDCSRVTMDDPFLCLDLCYISALLHEGLGFNRTSALLVYRIHFKKFFSKMLVSILV